MPGSINPDAAMQRPRTPEEIPMGAARLWLAPAILGTVLLSMVALFLVGPFWTMPPIAWLALGLLVIAVAVGWYMVRWSRRRALTCAPEGLHVRGAGREHVVPWSQISTIEVGHNVHYGGRDNWSLEVTRTDGEPVRELSRFVFGDAASAEHARTAIRRWRAAFAPAAG